jgi:hypothetical protein
MPKLGGKNGKNGKNCKNCLLKPLNWQFFNYIFGGQLLLPTRNGKNIPVNFSYSSIRKYI